MSHALQLKHKQDEIERLRSAVADRDRRITEALEAQIPLRGEIEQLKRAEEVLRRNVDLQILQIDRERAEIKELRSQLAIVEQQRNDAYTAQRRYAEGNRGG